MGYFNDNDGLDSLVPQTLVINVQNKSKVEKLVARAQ